MGVCVGQFATNCQRGFVCFHSIFRKTSGAEKNTEIVIAGTKVALHLDVRGIAFGEFLLDRDCQFTWLYCFGRLAYLGQQGGNIVVTV